MACRGSKPELARRYLRRRQLRPGFGFQKPEPAAQPFGGRGLDQDRHQDGDEGDGGDHLRAGRFHAEQQAGQRCRNDAGLATSISTVTTATPPIQYLLINAKSTCAPSRMKMNRRMMNAVVSMYSSSFWASPASILKPNVSLLPSTMPNTNTAMKPLASMPAAAK